MRRIDLRALALDARGSVYVQSREERDKLHAYLSKSVGGGENGRRVSSSGAPPNCSVSCEGMSSSELAHWAKVIGCKATTNPVLDAKAKDTFYHAGNLGQESEAEYERAIGFKAGDNVERSGVPGAIYKVLKINDNGSVIIRMFLDAETWDGPMTTVSYDDVIAGRLKKTDKVPRRRAKDAIKPLDYRLSNTCTHCNGTGQVMNGGMRRDCGVCRGTGKLGYSYKVYDAETSHDPRDGKFTSGGGSKSVGNPRRFGSSGRGRVSPEAEKRFAEEMERGRKKPEAKDQVPGGLRRHGVRRIDLKALVLDNFKESDHPRDKSGQFGSGSGGGGKSKFKSQPNKGPKLRQADLDDVAQVLHKQNQGWTAEEIAENEGIDEGLVERAMSGIFGKTPEDAEKYFKAQQAKDRVPQDCFDAQILGV